MCVCVGPTLIGLITPWDAVILWAPLASARSCCGLMDMASHVNDADDNVDAADDDVYAGYVFISVTAGSNFFSLLAIAFIMFFFSFFFFLTLLFRPASSAAYA